MYKRFYSFVYLIFSETNVSLVSKGNSSTTPFLPSPYCDTGTIHEKVENKGWHNKQKFHSDSEIHERRSVC